MDPVLLPLLVIEDIWLTGSSGDTAVRVVTQFSPTLHHFLVSSLKTCDSLPAVSVV
uniref:Uncharacterized protein n=1 Tax=Anguilla anguilla TaxID=7936 RepID=A0A0E9S8R4_ANGAN